MLPRVPRSGGVEVESGATPDQVWNVVGDVTRIGEWSHECRSARWLDENTQAVVGARFRGRNRAGLVGWGRSCIVTEASAPSRLVYRTRGSIFGDATEWTIAIDAVGAGSRITMSYRVLTFPRWFEMLVVVTLPAHRDRRDALQADLVRLAAVAAAPTASART
jgi:hypothetical protein